MREAVGVGAGLKDVASEGEPVDDRGGYLDFDLRTPPLTS
jgi:hypothetical protein